MRTSSTSTWGMSSSSLRCTTSATAPFSMAWGAKVCASTCRPGVQKNSAPASTRLESMHSDAISTSILPKVCTLPGIFPISAFSFILKPPESW